MKERLQFAPATFFGRVALLLWLYARGEYSLCTAIKSLKGWIMNSKKLNVMRFTIVLVTAIGMLSESATADVIQLTFEGLRNLESINGFYSGGTGGFGSFGSNFGVEFSNNAIAGIDSDAGGTANTGGEPSGDTIMYFHVGHPFVNVAAGFDSGFATYYSSPFDAGSIEIYDGLNGTGNLLTSLLLPLTPDTGAPDPNGVYSPFIPVGVEFSGVAHSVLFIGVGNKIAFDNLTFGSGSAVVPEPSTLALFGLGTVGMAVGAYRRRKSAFVNRQNC